MVNPKTVPTFVLIHSPLCGPATWQGVAAALRARGRAVRVPAFRSDEQLAAPVWQQEAQTIAAQLADLPVDEPLLWVAHSGAGLRLPAYRAAQPNPAAGYVFVDAGIPRDVPPQGLSQLDAMRREQSGFADELAAHLRMGGRFPEWTDDLLRDSIPDSGLRAATLRELQPRGPRYFYEPLPLPAGWPDAPCACINFSATYAADLAYACAAGWRCHEMPAGHFHMLVDPVAVAGALLSIGY